MHVSVTSVTVELAIIQGNKEPLKPNQRVVVMVMMTMMMIIIIMTMMMMMMTMLKMMTTTMMTMTTTTTMTITMTMMMMIAVLINEHNKIYYNLPVSHLANVRCIKKETRTTTKLDIGLMDLFVCI